MDRRNRPASWKEWAKRLRRKTYALYLAYRDPRVPWYAKLIGAFVVAYALSPIDLIPDFIPVIGYLDDLILIPLGIALAIRLIPEAVMQECLAKADEALSKGPRRNWAAGAVVIGIWAAAGIAAAVLALRKIAGSG